MGAEGRRQTALTQFRPGTDHLLHTLGPARWQDQKKGQVRWDLRGQVAFIGRVFWGQDGLGYDKSWVAVYDWFIGLSGLVMVWDEVKFNVEYPSDNIIFRYP